MIENLLKKKMRVGSRIRGKNVGFLDLRSVEGPGVGEPCLWELFHFGHGRKS